MAKKKLPKVLALLDEDLCTGCEGCLVVCPVDCIGTVPGPRHQSVHQVCTIDLPRCIGCTLCQQVCPWDCITMIPTDQFLQNDHTVTQLDA
jgi:electron transport complex protein RnfB